MAGVLAYGPRAVASHHSAGWLWELRPPGTADVHVTVPGRARHAQDGIRLHCVRSLSCEDAAVREAVPVTTVSRTLLDLAEALGPRQLRRLVEDAERLRLFDRFAIDDLCERSRGRRGVRALRAVLADRIEPAPTRSELERRFLELCRDADLPAPSVNAGVLGYEVDALWPERRVVVELDSYGFHRARSAFEQDRLRDAALQVAGYRVLRITDRRLRTGARAVVQEVRSLLEPQG
jgi:very-short-patch-repair endonuclease